jgi:hypothetical protein
MKNYVKLIITSCILLSSEINAQNISPDSYFKYVKTKFTVPDAPAFNILNETPSNILKPSSVKDISVSLSDFLNSDQKITLPKSFALEFSPALLINGKNIKPGDYAGNEWLYRMRLSIATKRDDKSGSATSIAFGLRITDSDSSDSRGSKIFNEDLKQAVALSEKINDAIAAKREKLGPHVPFDKIINDPEIQKIIENVTKELNEMWSSDSWNKSISEFALAVKADSKDSLAKNLELTEISAWYSKAFQLGKWGQILTGANADYRRNIGENKYKGRGSIAARMYAGSNNYKIYAEMQSTFIDSKKPEWLFNSGLEMRIEENLWMEFTAGLEKNESSSNSLVTDFKLKYGI